MEASFKSVVAFGKSVTVVHLNGRTEVESVALFRQACRGPLIGKNILFNFQKLNFVGSMSLRSFLESLHFLATDARTDVRFCGVSPDFRLVLDATPLRFRPAFATEEGGIASFEYEAPRVGAAMPSAREGQASATQAGDSVLAESQLEDEYIDLNDQSDGDFSVEG